MILFFSGTGNSEYVAKRMAKELNQEVVDVALKIKNNDYTTLSSEQAWVIVAPTYAWRIPRILEDYLTRTQLEGSDQVYFVMTCGGNIGNAGKYLHQWAKTKKLQYRGCYPIVMPENYLAMFATPDRETALQMINKAQPAIAKAITYVKANQTFLTSEITIKDKMNSSVVNNVFYPLFVHAKKFYATDQCTSCTLCVKVCPLNNIQMKEHKPSWGKNCTHCMACICRCPVEAIEYGKHSVGRPRYQCPK